MRAIAAFACLLGVATEKLPIYKDRSASVDARVRDLLSKMTLEEKVAQLQNPVGDSDGPGNFAVNASYILANYGKTGLGTLYSGIGGCPEGTPNCQNYIQAAIVNSSRLGIPISFIGETLVSGGGGATIFPQPILQGATFNVDLLSKMGKSIAFQARLNGIDRGLSPLMQPDTDSRFGRFEESLGEDPYLVGLMGTAVAQALSGSEGPNAYLPDYNHISHEAKHFFAYGAGGRDWYGVNLDDRALFDMYGRPWRAFIRGGGRGLMVAHPEVSGLPLHGSPWALTYIIREWFGQSKNNGTGDYIIIGSDWGNVDGIEDHGITNSKNASGMQAVFAGLDNEMSPPPLALGTLVDSYNKGLINIKYIDRAAGNNLREKFAAGLFDMNGDVPGWFVNDSKRDLLDTPADRQLAYEIASEGIVLLKNDIVPSVGARILPLGTSLGSTIRNVALLGPGGGCVKGEKYPCLAQQMMGGHYTNYGAAIDTLASVLGTIPGLSITQIAGASIDDYNTSELSAATAAASASDLAIVAVGDSIPISTGSCSEMSDTDDTDLPGSQLMLLNATVNTGKPVILVLFTCRPVTFGAGPFSMFGPNNALLDRVYAVVSAFRSGEAGASAVVDILTGAVNPSGRLTQNWVRHVGALHGPESPYLQARGALVKDYVTKDPISPLFPFGWGLSYSNFSFSNVQLSFNPSTTTLQADDSFNVSGLISSVGPAGKISLLIYFSQNAPTKWTRYINQLCAFGKFSLPADASNVPFSIAVKVRDFEAYEPDTKDYEVQTGIYTVSLKTDVQSPAIASFTNVNVNGTYTWVWDYTK
jgi:beta-glucosidase-like glycosyl hydrolase